ncbi:MAG: cytochrome c-type biogenesis protein [Pseudomonadota bacterium]
MLRLAMVLALLFAGTALADGPAEDERAKTLFSQLRCVVCQNQSIADSDAAVAADLRNIVRTKIDEGASDAAIIQYLVERYGEFVLLRPRFQMSTLLLWGAPLLVFAGGVGVLLLGRLGAESEVVALTDEEEARLQALLERNSKA